MLAYYNTVKNNILDIDDYLLIYIDSDRDESIIAKIKEHTDLKIVKFLLNTEDKKYLDDENIIEIYNDSNIEDLVIKDAEFVIYISNKKRSNNLIESLKKYKTIIIYEEDEIEELDVDGLKDLNDDDILEIISDFEILYNTPDINLSEGNSSFSKNIDISYNKLSNNTDTDMINMITYYKKSDKDILNTIQKKCIYENLNNNNISRVHIFGSNLKEEFQDIFKEFNSKKEIILNELEENVSFKDIVDYANSKLLNKIIFVARSDIILPNQNELDDLKFDLTNNNDIYSLSRIDRLINGNLVRSDKLNKILYCNQQDAWIFKSPLNIDDDDNNDMKNILFYDKYSELYFNKILINNNYNVINDTNKLKIIRLLHENNMDNRELIDEADIDEDDEENIYILPDNSSLSKITIDKLINFIGIDDKELYNLKCYIFNKYFKNKIIDEI
jgi:hypothetical protein